MWVSGLRYDGVFLVLCDFSLTPVEDPVWSEKKAKSLRTAPDPSIEAKRYKKKMRKLKYIYKFNLFFLFAFFFVSSAMRVIDHAIFSSQETSETLFTQCRP
jgi:hypothetical protein